MSDAAGQEERGQPSSRPCHEFGGTSSKTRHSSRGHIVRQRLQDRPVVVVSARCTDSCSKRANASRGNFSRRGDLQSLQRRHEQVVLDCAEPETANASVRNSIRLRATAPAAESISGPGTHARLQDHLWVLGSAGEQDSAGCLCAFGAGRRLVDARACIVTTPLTLCDSLWKKRINNCWRSRRCSRKASALLALHRITRDGIRPRWAAVVRIHRIHCGRASSYPHRNWTDVDGILTTDPSCVRCAPCANHELRGGRGPRVFRSQDPYRRPLRPPCARTCGLGGEFTQSGREGTESSRIQ